MAKTKNPGFRALRERDLLPMFCRRLALGTRQTVRNQRVAMTKDNAVQCRVVISICYCVAYPVKRDRADV